MATEPETDWLALPGTHVARTYDVPEGNPRVSIVMPLFNRAELTVPCVESLVKNTPEGLFEIIFVDNGSTDSTSEFLACLEGNVKVIVNEENRGFSTACNQGAAAASTDLVLFLNNDIEAQPGWLEPMLRVLDEDPLVAAVGSRLLFPDGTIQHAGVVLVETEGKPSPMYAIHVHYKAAADFGPANEPYEYQVLTGACLLMHRGVFRSVGGFDTGYWNGYEDVDLCLKVGEAGWKLVYEPRSCLVHHESQSGPERFSKVSENEERLCSRWFGRVPVDVRLDAANRQIDAPGKRARPYLGASWDAPAATQVSAPADAARTLTTILVLTRNQLEHTKLCLDSIRRHTSAPHEVLVVDNGSTDGTVEWLRERAREDPRVRVIEESVNHGFAGGNNIGLAHARGDQIVLLNNDTVVTRGWLRGLTDVFAAHPDVGLVGPVTNYASGPQMLPSVPYDSLEGLDTFADAWAMDHAGEVVEATRLVGFCLAARREVVADIGGLDVAFGAGNCEDDDWCLRAAQAGWKARIARGVFIHHTGGRTFKGERVDYGNSLETNFEVFKSKWGMAPDAKVEEGYRFHDLVRGPRQPFIPLKGSSASAPAAAGSATASAPAATGSRPADSGSGSEPAPGPVPAGKVRLQAGVLGEGVARPELTGLFRRYGHQGPLPVADRTSIVADWLEDSQFVLLVAPDVSMTDDALEEMVTVMHGTPTLAALGPLSSSGEKPQRLSSRPRVAAEAPAFARKRRRRHRGKWGASETLGLHCLLLRSSAAAEVGGLVRDLPLETALEDLLGRLQDDGHAVGVARGAWVDHSPETRPAPAGS
ncbi:MAG: glycosyltransferase family 2 protein [Gemmatimonadetes bacterium]|nr:glycosyltransferase family 2 protein [Gemmatimonadota bacterium]